MRKEVGTSSAETAQPEDNEHVPTASPFSRERSELIADDEPGASGADSRMRILRSSSDEDDEDAMIPCGDGYMVAAAQLKRHNLKAKDVTPTVKRRHFQASFTSEEDNEDLNEEIDEDLDGDDEDDRTSSSCASSCSHESPISDMTISMRMCNSEGYNTSPDVTNNWKSASEMKMTTRKRIAKRLAAPEMLMRTNRRELTALLEAKKAGIKNGQRTRSAFKKNTTSSFSQTGDHDEGGTTVNELLLSAPKVDQTVDTFSWPKRRLDSTLTARPIATPKHRNRISDGSRIISNCSTALSTLDSNHYCHRSVAVQTLPDDEYPSHYYYHTPNFKPHVIDSPLIKCIMPEDLPPRKQVVQDSSPEGTLRLVIENFSLMSDTVRGPSKVVHDVPWRIMIMPRQHIVQKKGTTQKCLGFFLQCCPDAYSDSWSCQAAAELKLISQRPGIQNFSRKTNHVYTAKENDWGYSCFMTWADILDENQGYILNDSVILEVHVKADRAKNILSLSEFRKKINEYIRVAQMQCERGLIDKAIDCNSQAMKFCKDKDPECCRRLQTQHDELVAQKLKQSIARIERGGDSLTGEADPAANITALRMAMTGNSARASAQNRSKRGKDAKSTDKRRDLDQLGDRTMAMDTTDFGDEQNAKTDTRNSNSSTVTSDKENDGQKESSESQNSTKRTNNSAGELHTPEGHCRTIMSVKQLKDLALRMSQSNNVAEAEQLLKYLSDNSGDEEALQIMNDMFMEELLDEDNNAAEKLALPFRFELLARSLICSGGYTFADIVEKESNLLFQMIVNQKPFTLNVDPSKPEPTDALSELARRSREFADSYLGLNTLKSHDLQKLDSTDESRCLVLPRSIKKLVAKAKVGIQTDLAPFNVESTKIRRHDNKPDWMENINSAEIPHENTAIGIQTELAPFNIENSKIRRQDVKSDWMGNEHVVEHSNEIAIENLNDNSTDIPNENLTENQSDMNNELTKEDKKSKTLSRRAATNQKPIFAVDPKIELEALRKEQKAWNKEKNQLLKTQKLEKAQLESTKQECSQLRNAQKTMQKKENELTDELERVRSQLETTKAKLQERETQHARELQSLNDVKRNYTKELAERQSAIQKLKEQLDERGNTIKKLEQSVSQEKRSSQKMAERAKTAEITLMDNRIDQAVRNLERTRTDCDIKVEQIEQRLEAGNLSETETTRLKNDIQTLHKLRDDINRLVEETRAEGQKHIEQLREGKQLSQLGRISFTKPPAIPNIEPLPPVRLAVPSQMLPMPTQAQMAQPPPSTPEFTPPMASSMKHFIPPHTQAHMPVRTPLNIPPPQHSPAASAFRPLSSGPSMSLMGGNPVPPSFTSQPPPPFMQQNKSIQHQHMAPYLSPAQQSHPEIPMFMPNSTVSNPIHQSSMPGPIGSRPLNFQPQKSAPIGVFNHTSEALKAPNGTERLDTASTSLTTSPQVGISSGRRTNGTMDGVRSLWEDDSVREVFDNADSGPRSGTTNARGTPNTRPADPTSNDIWGGYFSWMLDK
ncbi:MATH domain-containing protein [Aphelenchoides besseyi]|nr:MATH domain-containing protein [Aphelenchoides besseyi]